MKSLKNYILFFLWFITLNNSAQVFSIDSLKKVISTTKNDSIKLDTEIKLLENLGVFRISRWDSVLKKAIKLKYKNYEAQALNNIGFLYQNQNNIDSALKYFTLSFAKYTSINLYNEACNTFYNIACAYRSLNIYDKAIKTYKDVIFYSKVIDFKNIESYCYNDMAIICFVKGDLSNALYNLEKCVKIQENLNDYNGLATSYNNIANIYVNQNELNKAYEIYKKCFFVYKKNNDEKGKALTLANVAAVYFKQGKNKEALNLYLQYLKKWKNTVDKKNYSTTLNSVGSIYLSMDSSDLAEKYLKEAIIIRTESGDKKGLIDSYNNLIVFELKKNKLNHAFDYAIESLKISKNIGYLRGENEAYLNLYKIYKRKGNYKEAIFNYSNFIRTNDSLQNKENQKGLVQSLFKREYAKKIELDSLLASNEEKIASFKIKQQQNQHFYLNIAIVTIVILLIYIISRVIVINKQKKLIEFQKNEVEKQKEVIDEKQKEIIQSINYAKRIQESLLPSQKYLKKKLIS
jgi:tetratricopeptide (TPR) repeat protein